MMHGKIHHDMSMWNVILLQWKQLFISNTVVVNECGEFQTPFSKVICLLLFYAMETVFQLYHGGDKMYEMRRRKPKT